MKIATRIGMALFLAMAMGACGGDDDNPPAPDAPPGAADAGPDASAGATVSASAAPDTLMADEVTMVTITVTNFTLEAPGGANADGHGHYHIYLDNETGANYLVADFVSPVAVTIPAGTAAGAHTLRVALHNNDHSPVAPAVETTVNITIQ